MNKIMLIVINVITGLFVGINTLIGYGLSGIGEGSTNNIRIFMLMVIWVVGLILQLTLANKLIGLVITFIPVIFLILLYTAAYLDWG
ncbi:hypothetical protein KP77_11110 [Jeotgalibacillus alimentarius]|uniref:Uncharacterized protein n=1 Tax=Jeotgalibacillus alimentarius TaxID=135826 RepID=A0A0C2SCC3_9BACL|nr:hypothetical protein [Jeotgalibacillus alimentarius]KIL51599.1 hypothetical protein KP77_11110 [Jeotgalibacillus alimentarius]